MPRRLKELSDFSTVRELMINNYVEYAQKTAFMQLVSVDSEKCAEFEYITYEQFYKDINALGTFLTRECVLPDGVPFADAEEDSLGDQAAAEKRSVNFAIMGDNSYYYALSCVSVMCGIGTALPLGRTVSDEKIAEIFNDLDIKHAFVHPSYAHRIPDGVKIYSLDPIAMQGYIEKGRDDQDATDIFLTSPISDSTDICLALSSNGEKGRRKFARITNLNLTLAINALQKKVKITHADRFMSVLPLAFYAEFVVGMLFPLSRGACVAYGADTSQPLTDLFTVFSPTVTVSTPGFIENVYSVIWSGIQKNGKGQSAVNFIKMVENAGQVRRGLKQNMVTNISSELGGRLSFLISVGDGISSGARSGMRAFGIPVTDIYGMAECPVISIKTNASDSDKSLGERIPDVNVTINSAEHDGIGNIRIKGRAVCLGYCNERHNKKYLLRDGRIITGDIGTVSSDGRILLVGKKTTAFESSKPGKMIYPEQLETALCAEYNIAEALVYGEKITNENGEEITAVCAKVRPDPTFVELHGAVASKKMVRDVVDRINSILFPYKRIEKVTVVFEELPRNNISRIIR